MEPSEYEILFAQEEWHCWFRALRSLVEERISSALGPTEGEYRILDAGCGTGGMLRRLEGLGSAFAVDNSRLAVGLARRRAAAFLSLASVTSLPFRSSTFDLVLSLDVLYHRQVEGDLTALREARRCLRPGGVLVLNLPAYSCLRSRHDTAVHTARRYHHRDLRRLLGRAGFEVERITYWNTLLFPALAVYRLLGRAGRSDARPSASDVRTLPGALNRFLQMLLDAERIWLRRLDLPFGLSLMAVARRPGGDVHE
jgi:SAM-dependent methyltransferase